MTGLIKKILYMVFAFRSRFVLKRKIKSIKRHKGEIDKPSTESIKHHRALWRRLGAKPRLDWFRLYMTINQNEDPRYINEIDYYTIVEPILNNRGFSEAYCDKNSYHIVLESDLLPKIHIRNIHGIYCSESYRVIDAFDALADLNRGGHDKVIVKKSVDTGGGRGIQLFFKDGAVMRNQRGDELSIPFLEKEYNGNFLVQQYLHQHPYFEQFNRTSLNTVRLFTYRSVLTNRIVPLQAILRIGKHGSIVDNQASGGVSCGIDKNGNLNDFAVNKNGEKFESHNGVSFRDVSGVYGFERIVAAGLKIAEKYFHQRLLGLDLCVDIEGKIKLIEVNNRNNEINFYQMNNGPLFGDYTEEVIDYCLNHKVSFAIDFEI